MSDTYTPGAGYARRHAIERSSSDQAIQLHNLALNTDILTTVNPWMGSRPELVMELAGSGLPPDQLATQGAALYGMVSMDGLQSSLEGLTPVAQRSVYGRLTETQQRALNQLGYQPPSNEDGGSILGNTLGLVGSVAKPIWEGVSTVAGPPLGAGLDALTWIGDQPAHLYRTIRSMDSWQQWVAVGGAAAALALAPVTFGGSLAAAGTLASVGILGGSALAGATVAAAATDPGEWWDALNSTWDGEKVFTRGAQREARELLVGDHLTSMAKSIALELDPYELATQIAGERDAGSDQQIMAAIERVAKDLADFGSPEYEQIFAGLHELVQQEPFRDAIDTLQQSKISFGRDLAGAAGFSPDDAAYGFISGAADALWLVSMDPLMATGSIVKWNRVRRYGAGTAGGEAFLERLTHLSNTDALTRANHETISYAVRTGDFTAMPAAARGMWRPLREYQQAERIEEFSRADLLKFFHEADGITRILEGKGTIRGIEHAVISRRSDSAGWGRFVKELRDFRDAADDVVLERHLRELAAKHGVDAELDEWLPANVLDEGLRTNLVELGDVEVTGPGIGATLGKKLGQIRVGDPAVSLMASITRMTPASKAIRVTGEGSEIDIPRLVETMGRTFNMPSSMRDEWLNRIMVQGSTAQRFEVMQAFLDTSLSIAGLRSNDELSKLADIYLHKHRQAYGLGGLDTTVLDGIPAKTGIYPELHQASLLVMPDLPEMLKAVRRGHIIKHIARVADSNFVEASMSRFWKPAVLMRIGFIPRAAGEEALAWAARMGEGGLAQEFGARSLAQWEAAQEAQRVLAAGGTLNEFGQAALRWQVPTHARPLVRMFSRTGWADPVEEMLGRYGDSLRGFLDDGLGLRVGDPEWYHGLLYGKQQSWRRMIAGGIDPDLRDAARSWVSQHGDAIMRATSSMNASVLEKSVVNPDVEYFMMEDPKNPGQLIETPMMTVGGRRDRVYQGDHRFPAAVHHRMAEAFDDDIVGPVLARMYAHYFPGFDDLQPANVNEAIQMSRQVRSFTGRKLVAEALQPRTDNLRAAAEVLRDADPLVASILDDAMVAGELQWSELIEAAKRARKGAKKADLAKLDELTAELEAVAPMIEGMQSLSPASQAWMAQALSADMATGGRMYNADAMKAWAEGGAVEVTGKRPERLLYRGVKDASTIEILPNGDLRLRASFYEEWAGEAISTSIRPDQSLSYAVSPLGFNEPGAYRAGLGAMIELDADYVLAQMGTTYDDVIKKPIVVGADNPAERLTDRYGRGAHLIGGGEDQSEIALVMGRTTLPEDHDEVLHGFEVRFSQAEDDVAREAIRAERDAYQASIVNAETDMIIPAGRWAIQDQGAMREIVESLQAGAETRWPWLRDLTFETESGRPIEDLLHEFTDQARRARESGNVDEIAEYFNALSDDERDILHGVVGYRTDEHSRRRFAEAVVADDRHTRSIEEFLALRGQGRFEIPTPAWSPFHTDRESFNHALEEELFAQLMRPENNQHVRASRFAMQTSDGRKVAQPLQEGVQRVYVPTIGANPQIAGAVERAQSLGLSDEQLIVGIVDELLAQPNAYRVHADFIRRLPHEQQQQALADAVTAYLARSVGGNWSVPMSGIAFDDPRIAQWVSDVVTGGIAKEKTRTAYVDIPRGLGGSNSQRSDLAEAGRSWELAPEHDGYVSWIEADGMVTMPDGSQAPGVAFTEALRDYARTIARKVQTEHGARTRESYSALETVEGGSGLARRQGKGLTPIPAGEKFGGREDLFDAEGNPVNWADPNLFGLDVDTSDELLWPIIGPMARDYHERQAGLMNRVLKSKRKQLNSYREGEFVPEGDQLVSMTRSRVDDVHRTRELDLPNVALSEVRVPTTDTWWDRTVRWGFDRVIAPSIDAIVRTPMSFHYYAAAYKQNKQFLNWMLDKNLFETRIPTVFASHLEVMENATTMSTKQLQDGRTVARLMGEDLSEATDAQVTRWITSLGQDDDYVMELTRLQTIARRRNDQLTAKAAERLMAVDPAPFRMLGVAGEGKTTAERLVSAYATAIPDDVWAKGEDAINAALRKSGIGLPLLHGEQWGVMSSAVANYRHTMQTVEETAKLRAIENVVPFLDSHEQKSMFASMGRNLLPFWYAEELFLKRWARVLSIDGTVGLATLRKAQLGYMGIRSAGIVRTDANGNDWFVYPGSGLLGEAMSKLPFMPEQLPVGVMFQASPEQMLPGLNARFGTPSVSPWVAASMSTVQTLYPDARPLKEALLGDFGSSRGALDQFVPTTIRRVWDAAFSDDSTPRYASAMMSAAAMMEAEGNGVPDSATPEQLEEYMDRLRNHARVVMWAQAVTGFFVPGSPVAVTTQEDAGSFGMWTGLGVESPGELVSDQYRSYIQNYGIDQGTQRFLADFPNSDLEDVVNPLAFTVSKSSSVSGARLPATRTGMEWYDSNKGWVDSMPEAGAWFLPTDGEDAEFDYYSYSQQMVNGLRKGENPTDFVRSLKFRGAASVYFDTRDQYELAAIELGEDPAKKRMLDDAWNVFSQNWMNANPIFAEELVSGEARQRRKRTIDQLRYAVTDPSAPESPSLGAIREMSVAYDAYRLALMQLSDKRDATSREKVRALKDAWAAWAEQWTFANPEISQLWSAVFRPESSL